MKNIYFIIPSVFVLLYVILNVKKKKFSIKESFYWVLAAIVMLILSIFPYSIDVVAKWLNVTYPPSLLFVLCVIFLLYVNFRNSRKIAEQQEKIIELAQELAIVKHEKNK